MSARQRLILLLIAVVCALVAPQIAAKAHAAELPAGGAPLALAR